mmetsp:Transcript_22705/g.68369  ORF Transcript_22705/g.68369 Transcript_22705/m.68369 type:complete len:210 (+) Transcript_22705:37-666(+)
MHAFGWSTDMVAFGSGGGLLQKLNRDTLKCAYKCSWVEVTDADGKVTSRDVSKNPITDKGKKSKRGRLTLECNDGVWKTVENGDPAKDMLVEVFKNGELLVDHRYTDIRARADVGETAAVEPFVSSEPWVKEFDAWAKDNLGDKAPESKAHLYKASEDGGESFEAVLAGLEGRIKEGISKEELVSHLTALNALNSKLLGLARSTVKAPE